MDLQGYFSQVSEELSRQSERVRTNFKTHRPSAGDNRESIVAKFLKNHIPNHFAIDTGLVASSEGVFSNQADVLICDSLYNAPLYADMSERVWFVEAVCSLIEVKSNLSPSDIKDSIDKCVNFKKLKRQFGLAGKKPNIEDSLFILWGFDCPKLETFAKNYIKCLNGIQESLHPDFVVVPGKIIVKGGQYNRLSKYGQETSEHRRTLIQNGFSEESENQFLIPDIWELNDNTLLAFFSWLNSWLVSSVPRIAPMLEYLSEGIEGRSVTFKAE